MPRLRPTLQVLPVVLALFPGVGCSSIASTFGFTPPVHKLTEPAELMRAGGPGNAPLPKELNKAWLPVYVVEPGDTLVVEPVDLDSPVRLPGNQPVLPDGTIDLGRYGRPVAAGKSVAQVEAEVREVVRAGFEADLREQLKGKADDQAFRDQMRKGPGVITVRLVGRESKVYYVLGEVSSPRAYPLAGRETALDGIVTAGGLTRQADTAKIILSRPTQPDGCRVVLPVCYDNIVQLGDTSTNYQLQPGDRIYVPSKGPFDGFLKFINGHKGECGPCVKPQVGCGTYGACATGCAPAAVPPAAVHVPAPVIADPPSLPVPAVPPPPLPAPTPPVIPPTRPVSVAVPVAPPTLPMPRPEVGLPKVPVAVPVVEPPSLPVPVPEVFAAPTGE